MRVVLCVCPDGLMVGLFSSVRHPHTFRIMPDSPLQWGGTTANHFRHLQPRGYIIVECRIVALNSEGNFQFRLSLSEPAVAQEKHLPVPMAGMTAAGIK